MRQKPGMYPAPKRKHPVFYAVVLFIAVIFVLSYMIECARADTTITLHNQTVEIAVTGDSSHWFGTIIDFGSLLGDVNGSGGINSADIIELVNFVFRAKPLPELMRFVHHAELVLYVDSTGDSTWHYVYRISEEP